MGVPGLWDLIRPAAVRTSLHALGRDAFLANNNGLRALTIGIDASIWIFHAQTNRNGANAFLRTIFYKITALLQHPVLPVFVFDGPQKPSVKRNKHVTGNFGVNDGYSRKFKDLLDVCGLEWWNAPGEAEAELALMNRQGKIDAVLSDDVDALLFGATCLLRNNSPTLSGAQASSTQNNSHRTDLRHYEMYRINDIVSEWTKEDSALKTEDDCQRAMVMVALLGGGDYVPEGAGRMGPKISFALAKAGHADFLKHYAKHRFTFDRKVAKVHDDIINELRTNRSGHVGRRNKKLADDLAEVDLFPSFPLNCYLCPATSPSDDPGQGWPGFGKGEVSSGRGRARNMGRGDLEGMARACERYFEWGTREIVCKKFASDAVNLFGAEIVAEARGAARSMVPASRPRQTLRPGQSPDRITSYFSQSTISSVQGQKSMSTTSTRHLVKIHSTRPSPMCSSMTEFRLEYQTKGYMDRCRDAMEGTRADPSTLAPEERAALGMVSEAGAPTDTAVKDEMRIWVPDYLIRAAWPHLIAKYEEEEAGKAAKKAAPKKKAAAGKTTAGQGRKKAPVKASENTGAFTEYFTHPPATQSAVREAERVAAGQPVQRHSRSASHTSASSELTPALSSPIQGSSRASIELSPGSPSSISLPPSSPDWVVCSLPSPPVSPNKRGRSARSQLASRGTSPCPSSDVSTPLTSRRRSRRKKRATPPRVREASTASGAGTEAEPIELLSSDDELTPRPPRPSAVANGLPSPTPSRQNSPPKRAPRGGRGTTATASSTTARSRPTPTVSSTPLTAPARIITTSTTHILSTQSRLDSMVVARARKSQSKIAKEIPSLPKPKLPYFVVTEDEDGVEHIDLTQRRKR